MTVQRWTDEMLDQLTEKIAELTITAQALLQIATQHQQRLERSEEDLEQIKQRQQEQEEKLDEKIADLTVNVDGVRITAQALLQIVAQHEQKLERSEEDLEEIKQRQEEEKEEMKRMQQRQAENDERFNILLEEVRYLIRRNDNPPPT